MDENYREPTDVIHASQAGAILGLSPYKRPVEVWSEMRGLAAPTPDNYRMKRGRWLEQLLADDYTERHGVQLEPCGTITHPDYDWLVGTPDRVLAGRPEGVEIKTAGSRQRINWRADSVPDVYAVQCVIYTAIRRAAWWDLYADVDGEIEERRLPREIEPEQRIIDALTNWRNSYILADVPPPPEPEDGSEYARAVTAALRKGKEFWLCPGDYNTLKEAADVAAEIKRLEGIREGLRNVAAELLYTTGLHGLVDVDGNRLVVQESRGSIDWEAAAREAGVTPDAAEKYRKESRRSLVLRPAKI